jgi:hypothetical protein
MNDTTGLCNQTFTSSLYLNFLNRNRCIKGDYQNIGINGMTSKYVIKNAKLLNRNKVFDYPLTLIIAFFFIHFLKIFKFNF